MVLVLALVFSLSLVSAGEVDDEIKKLTHYAEGYETGNIDYVQLMVYSSSVREKLNEMLGVVSKEEGGLLKQEQIKQVLGEPDEWTKWVWVEMEEREVRLGNEVPVWKKIVFDGKKIQIRLSAQPTLFKKKDFGREENGEKFEQNIEDFDIVEGGYLVYRLHFETEFKRPQEELDIISKFVEIQELAEYYSSNPSQSNAESLAKESVNIERTFEPYFRQSSEDCGKLMNSIFGSENKREIQKVLVQEVEFYGGDNFEAILRLEMCDDCEWHWIGMNLGLEGRGPGFKFPENAMDTDKKQSKERFKDMGTEGFEAETKELVSEMRRLLENGDYGQAMSYSHRLQMLTDAWNEKANNVWEELDKTYRLEEESMSEEERRKIDKNYGWIKREQEKRAKMKDLAGKNYQERKLFYLELFSDYEKKDFYFKQEEWEKRLVEEFREFGEEVCDNNKDDNDNGEIDCAEAQCGGKFCGKFVDATVVGDESGVVEKELYCIAGTCQVKEEIITEKGAVCGNNICEPGEMGELTTHSFPPQEEEENVEEELLAVLLSDNVSEEENGGEGGEEEEGDDSVTVCHIPPGNPNNAHTIIVGASAVSDHLDHGDYLGECTDDDESLLCPQDCVECLVYDALPCSGEVIFSGEDENGCPLPPICIGGEGKCKTNEECVFLCGEGECVWENEADEFGECRLIKLEDCVKPDCVAGEKKIERCQNRDEVVVEICVEGLWEETGVKCEKGGGLGCGKCGNGCMLIKDMMAVDCMQPTEEFECVEENGQCVKKEERGESCTNYCNDYISSMIPECPGHMEISGGYPDCDCNWICDEGAGEECRVKSDCGGENDVCSNGKCVTLPGKVKPECAEINCETGYECVPETGECKKIEGWVEEEEEEKEEEGVPPAHPEEEEESEVPKEQEQEEPEESEQQESEPESEPEVEPEAGAIIGEVVFAPLKAAISYVANVFLDIGKRASITGYAVNGDGGDSGDGDGGEGWEDNYDNNQNDDWEDRDREGSREMEEDNEERCKKDCNEVCYNNKIRPCVESCIRESCGDELDCDVDEESVRCEENCKEEKDVSGCVDDCFGKCVSGKGDFWEDVESDWDEEEHKEEKGVYLAGGSCRVAQGKTEGFIFFDGWGESFEGVRDLKHKYYQGGEADWCKYDFENLKKQRAEFEQGFDEEFVKWFFEDYLANSAEDWEQAVSGIFELYWSDVDISREMGHRMKCLGIDEFPKHELINVKYETEYGMVEFWEELKTARLPGTDEEIELISPYMKIWIFPSKQAMKSMFGKSMKKHEFPGPDGETGGGLSEEEKEEIRNDPGEMEDLREVMEKYGGSFEGAVQFLDYETGENVFNLYVEINEEELINTEPMLPEEMPELDARVELDFEKLYDIIYISEKEIMGIEVESPPWDRKPRKLGDRIKGAVSGAKMWLKMRSLMNSAEYYPASSEKEMKMFLKDFFGGMMGGPDGPPGDEDEQEGPGGCTTEEECKEYCENPENKEECMQFSDKTPEGWEDRKVMTGEVVRV